MQERAEVFYAAHKLTKIRPTVNSSTTSPPDPMGCSFFTKEDKQTYVVIAACRKSPSKKVNLLCIR